MTPRTPAACRSDWSGRAVFIPAICAGGLFCASLLLAIQQSFPAEAVPVESDPGTLFENVAGASVFLVLASLVGLVASALPILVGVRLLAAIGRWNSGSRHPAFWALIGAAAPAGVAVALGSCPDEPAVLSFVLTGASCAAIARRYVRWSPIKE